MKKKYGLILLLCTAMGLAACQAAPQSAPWEEENKNGEQVRDESVSYDELYERFGENGSVVSAEGENVFVYLSGVKDAKITCPVIRSVFYEKTYPQKRTDEKWNECNDALEAARRAFETKIMQKDAEALQEKEKMEKQNFAVSCELLGLRSRLDFILQKQLIPTWDMYAIAEHSVKDAPLFAAQVPVSAAEAVSAGLEEILSSARDCGAETQYLSFSMRYKTVFDSCWTEYQAVEYDALYDGPAVDFSNTNGALTPTDENTKAYEDSCVWFDERGSSSHQLSLYAITERTVPEGARLITPQTALDDARTAWESDRIQALDNKSTPYAMTLAYYPAKIWNGRVMEEDEWMLLPVWTVYYLSSSGEVGYIYMVNAVAQTMQ